ncbi:MAG TPA: DHH family phosphoesterase [Candidatus Limnocylindria bacterium]|nr:DHH family phosphoesterase [Candidatus Limnocylindria bacterium]
MIDVVDALRAAKRIAIVSHRDPDPDTIGSGLALGLALERLGKQVTWHCADPVPDAIRFLTGADRYQRESPPGGADLVVCVDFGEASRAKFALPPGVPVADIDHHATSTLFGATNFVDVTSAATGEMIGRIVDALGVEWTPDMATAALVAIMTDTGSFQFPNTDKRALERAALLRGAGADLQSITYNVFRNKRFEALKLWGFAFSRLVREDGGLLVWTWIERADLTHAEASEEDLSGLVEQIARSKGMRVALLFSGTTADLRVSCRTSASAPSVDASALMATFGGGGHVRAAGALIPPGAGADHPAVRERVLRAAREALAAARRSA